MAENSFWTQESWSVLRSGGMQWLKDESHREDALRKQMRNWERNKASKAVIESSRRRRNASAITGTLSNHWSPFWRYFYQFSFMFCLHGFFSVVVTFSLLNLVLCMDCEWERGSGFGVSNGLLMHEFEELLARLLGVAIRNIPLKTWDDGQIIRLRESKRQWREVKSTRYGWLWACLNEIWSHGKWDCTQIDAAAEVITSAVANRNSTAASCWRNHRRS